MIRWLIWLMLTVSGFAWTSAQADPGFSIGAQVGLLGWGPVVSYAVKPDLTLRAQWNLLEYDWREVLGDNDYRISQKSNTPGLLLNWHLLDRGFFLSAGVWLNHNDLKGDADHSDPLSLQGTVYSPEQLSALNFEADYRGSAFYLGWGWSSPASWRYGVLVETGFYVQHSPKIKLIASGTAIASSEFQANLAREKKALAAALDNEELLPQLAVSVRVNF